MTDGESVHVMGSTRVSTPKLAQKLPRRRYRLNTGANTEETRPSIADLSCRFGRGVQVAGRHSDVRSQKPSSEPTTKDQGNSNEFRPRRPSVSIIFWPTVDSEPPQNHQGNSSSSCSIRNPGAMFSKVALFAFHIRCTESVGPLRCLPTMISAVPSRLAPSGDLRPYRSGR